MANQQYPYQHQQQQHQQAGSSSYYHPPPNPYAYGYPNPNAPVYNPYNPYVPQLAPLTAGPALAIDPAAAAAVAANGHPPSHPHTPVNDARAQASPRMQAQPSPRMNGAGRGGGGGGYGHRGGHNGPVYAPQHGYHPMAHSPQHHYLPPHPAHAVPPPPPPLTHPYPVPPKYPQQHQPQHQHQHPQHHAQHQHQHQQHQQPYQQHQQHQHGMAYPTYQMPMQYPGIPGVPGTPDGQSPYAQHAQHPLVHAHTPGGWNGQTLSPLPKQLNALPHFGANPYSPGAGAAYVPSPHPLREEQVFENGIAAQTQAHEQQQQQQQQDQAHVADQEQSQQQAHEQEPVAEPVPEPAAVVEEAQSAVETADVAPITNEDPSEPAPDVAPDSQQDPDADTEPAPVYALQEEEEEDDTGTPAARTPPASGSASFQFISDGLTLPNPSDPAATDASGKWAVWTRRPTDPTLAPALLFSRRSRAPRQVVQQLIGEALDDTTPPASPAPAIRAPLTAESLAQMNPDADASTPAAMAKAGLEVATDAGMTEASVDVLPPVSEAATEVGFGTETQSVRSTRTSTPTSAPTPRSPLSSLTSISASPAVKSTAKIDGEVAPASESVAPATSSAAATAQGTPATSTTAPATPPVKAPPKSWASLLQGSSRSNLPTSTVVGFSIPAGLPSSSGSGSANANGTGSAALGDAVLPIAPAHRGELLNLLTRDPAGFAGWAPRIRPRGLLNQGNMCFANAVLQSLVYCPPFHRLFSDLGRLMLPGHIGPVVGQDKEKEKEKVGERKTPLVEATVQFVKEFEMKEIVAASTGTGKGKERERERAEADDDWEVSSFLPTYFYDAMKEKKRFEGMRSGQQEDAEEFLGFYLDTLEEELLTVINGLVPPAQSQTPDAPQGTQDAGWLEVGKRNRSAITRTIKSSESPITRVFGGKFRSTLRVPHQKDSAVVEDWRALQLDITPEAVHTIKDALQQLSQPQTVQVTSPTRAGQTVDAQQTVLIDALPPILVLHLKRFLYDTTVKDVVKVGKKVAFERELEIAPELMAPTSRKIGRPTKYKLFAVLYHHGLSASGGHYTLDVLHPNRDLSTKPREAWIRIDDELVSDVTPEDVFGGLERDDRCAYLLFYRRIGGALART